MSNDREMSLVEHLSELRDRLLRAVAAVFVAFLPFGYFANDVFAFVSEPFRELFPDGEAMMIATDPTSPVFTPFKLAFVAGALAAMPYVLYQAWAFIAPGMYRHERRFALPLMVSSVVLFYAGVAFAYYVVCPVIFAFIAGTTPEGVKMMPDIMRYLDFVLAMMFAFGFAFEIPVATVLLVWAGITTPASLVEKRPYLVVGCFVIGAVLTPPDVVSQFMLAIPLWVLYEIGVFIAGFQPARPKIDSDPAAS
jgi:sec-independent protein translocase protein TatC